MIKGFRIVLQVESSQPFTDYTGTITKTLVYALVPELQLTRGVKGVLSPVHISPLFTVKGDHDLGEVVMPLVEKKDNDYSIKPVEVNGEYVFHIGGENNVIDRMIKKLASLDTPLAIKIGQAIVKYKVEKVVEVTREAFEKAETINNKVRVYLKSPAQIFNVFAPTKLPKFTPSAVEVLMTPYAIMLGQYTITESLVISSFPVLGGLVETWYSIKTLEPVQVVFKGKVQTNLRGHVTYIVEVRDERLEEVRKVLATAEIVGVGRSRQNGFGTTIIVS